MSHVWVWKLFFWLFGCLVLQSQRTLTNSLYKELLPQPKSIIHTLLLSPSLSVNTLLTISLIKNSVITSVITLIKSLHPKPLYVHSLISFIVIFLTSSMSDKASTDFWYPKLTSEFLGFIFQTSTPSPTPLPLPLPILCMMISGVLYFSCSFSIYTYNLT